MKSQQLRFYTQVLININAYNAIDTSVFFNQQFCINGVIIQLLTSLFDSAKQWICFHVHNSVQLTILLVVTSIALICE